METKFILIDPMIISPNYKDTKKPLRETRKYHSREGFYRESKIPLFLRKNLPQTSNLLSKIKRKKSTFSNNLPFLKQISSISPRDKEVEEILLKNHKKILVSQGLSNLLLKLLTKFPNCQIIKDLYPNKKEVYKYLFDNHLNPVKDIEDLSQPLQFVIISCRSKIPEESLERSRTQYQKKTQDKKYSQINLYDLIIEKKKVEYKRRRSPIYILKYTKSYG